VRVNASTKPRRGLLRVGLVVLLVVAAFFAALPWIGCLASHPLGIFAFANDDFFMLRACTVGLPSQTVGRPDVGPPPPPGLPGFNGPYWGNLIVGVLYLGTALYAAFTKRPSL
jgi:hypothetical protein